MSLLRRLRTKVIGKPLDPLSVEGRKHLALAAFLAQHGVPDADIHVIAGCDNRRGPGGKVQRVMALAR